MWHGPISGRRLHLRLGPPRGVGRRVRALEKWARGCGKWFPSEADPDRPCLHSKIPILSDVVEGPHARHRNRVRCAQALIGACASLLAARPAHRADWRVTCTLSVPDLFSSELCIYTSEDCFVLHTGIGRGAAGDDLVAAGRSLSREWGLTLPPGVGEIGHRWEIAADPDESGPTITEQWHYGEVGPRA